MFCLYTLHPLRRVCILSNCRRKNAATVLNMLEDREIPEHIQNLPDFYMCIGVLLLHPLFFLVQHQLSLLVDQCFSKQV